MIKLKHRLLGLASDKRAVTALEYALIVTLVAIVAATGFSSLGTVLNASVQNAASTLP